MAKEQTDRLWRLIRSLTPSEKRAFRIASRTHGEQKKAYVLLFDIVEASTEGPPSDLAEALDGAAAVGSIPVLKNYLYRQILRVIREHGPDRAPGIRVWQTIEEARILYGKGLYRDARIHLEKARAIAERWEMHTQLQEIASIESNLRAENDDAATQLSSFKERIDLHDARREFLVLSNIVGRLSQELHRGPVYSDSIDRARYDRIIEELPEEPPPAEAYRRRSTWHYARATHAFGTLDFEGALRETSALIDHFSADSKRIDEAPEELVRQVSNRLLILHRLGRFEEFEAALCDARTTFDGLLTKRRRGDDPIRLQTAGTLWMREAIFRIEQRDYQRVSEIADEIEDAGLEELRQEQSIFWAILFHLCAIGSTMSGDLPRGVEWNTRTLAIDLSSRPEVTFAPLCLQIILHTKLKNHTLVTSLLRRLPRGVPTDPHFESPATALIELVRGLANLNRTARSRNRVQRAIENVNKSLLEDKGVVIFGHTPFVAIAKEMLG